MSERFGNLLRQHREAAGLRQIDLGQKIHIDGSMISRLETGRTKPNPATLQEIINALALHDVSREKLDELWDAAGYYRSPVLEGAVAHPVVVFIHQELEKLGAREKELLSSDLRSITEINQEYLSAKKDSKHRKWSRASEALQSLRKLVERRVQWWYARIDEELGWCQYSIGEYARAVQSYEFALWSAQQLADAAKEARILIKLGNAHRRCGGPEWEIARECYEEARERFESAGDDIGVADCIRRIAGVHLFQGRPNEGERLCDESLEMCRETGYELGEYKALQHKAWACDLLGRWDEASRYCEEALAIANRVTQDEWALAKALRYLGDAYRLEGRIDEAEEVYGQASSIVERLEAEGVDASLLVGMIKLGLGKVYLRQPGREREARSCLDESLEAHLHLGEDFRVADVLSQQADLLVKLGRLQEAEIRLELAAKRLRKLSNTFYYAIALTSQCELYYAQGEYDKVYQTAELARTADEATEKRLIDYHLARIELVVGKALADEERRSEAVEALCRASQKALDFNDQAFREIQADISSEVDRAAQEAGSDAATRLCQSQMEFWLSKLQSLQPHKRELVWEWVESVRQKQREIEALGPVGAIQ